MDDRLLAALIGWDEPGVDLVEHDRSRAEVEGNVIVQRASGWNRDDLVRAIGGELLIADLNIAGALLHGLVSAVDAALPQDCLQIIEVDDSIDAARLGRHGEANVPQVGCGCSRRPRSVHGHPCGRGWWKSRVRLRTRCCIGRWGSEKWCLPIRG